MWDYSWHNIDACDDNSPMAACDAPPRRYVPVAALDTPMFPPPRTHGSKGFSAPQFVFFGDVGHSRQGCFNYVSGGLRAFNVTIQEVFSVWSKTALVQWLRSFAVPPVVINLAKGCRVPVPWSKQRRPPLRSALAPRISLMLNAGALIISELPYPKDELEFDGLVDFDHVENLGARFLQLKQMSAPGRYSLALSRRNRFRSRFNATHVLERAGIYSLLRQKHSLRASTCQACGVFPTCSFLGRD